MSTPITLPLGACVAAESTLAKFASQPAPAKVAYHLSKLLRLVHVETAHFHEKRQALIKELGQRRHATVDELAKGAEPEVVQVPPEKMPTFIARLDDVATVEVEIAWRPLTLAQIEALPNVCATDLLALGPLLADEESAGQPGS